MGSAENHAPGRLGDPAPEFAIDEVCDPDQADAYGRARRDEISQTNKINGVRPREQNDGDGHPDHPPMKTHAPVPEPEHLHRIRPKCFAPCLERKHVKQHIAKTPSADNPEG